MSLFLQWETISYFPKSSPSFTSIYTIFFESGNGSTNPEAPFFKKNIELTSSF